MQEGQVYQIVNARIRSFQGEKCLSANFDTIMTAVKSDVRNMTFVSQLMENEESLSLNTIIDNRIAGVQEIQCYSICDSCCRRLSTLQSDLSICDFCGLSQIKTELDQTHFSVGIFIGGENNVLLRVLPDQVESFIKLYNEQAESYNRINLVYALSHPKDNHFQGTCDHAHDQSCSSCKGLDSVLSSIEASVRHKTCNLADEERDDMLYSCQQAVQAIRTWKAHQLCVLQQDKCRIYVLQELNFNEVLITQDWAMKFLPQKYRETQTDWFGKRGISWHVSFVVRREIHIAKNCSQDSNVVAAIMEHSL